MNLPKNQYIYRINLNRPELLTDGPTVEEAKILQDHVSYLERLAAESKVLLAGRTQIASSDAYGIVILSASSETDALDIMNNDPVVKHRVMQAEIHPYKIAVVSDSILRSIETST